MYTAMKIASYIIKKSIELGSPVDNLKLQKLLYYVQGASLCNKNEPMFSDEIVSYMYGPVVEEVYEKYEHNVSANIYYVESNDNVEDIKQEDIKIINFIIEKFRYSSSWALVEKTHNETPWKNTKKYMNINLNEMKKFFNNNVEFMNEA